ncbi:MAG: hypothetical protein U9N00_01125, partial [Candidatus Bipolaricaulota bacterium]|nr:hypothetical protein [Candidatus Bipolaricaulota bacterium]
GFFVFIIACDHYDKPLESVAIGIRRRTVPHHQSWQCMGGVRADAFLKTDSFVDQLRPLFKEKPFDPDYHKREPSQHDRAWRSYSRLFPTRQPATSGSIRLCEFIIRISMIAKRVHETMKS